MNKKMMITIFFLMSFNSYGYHGRLKLPEIGGEKYSSSYCEELRIESLYIGCIDDEDLSYLRTFNIYPRCSIIGSKYRITKNPLDMLISCGPCID